MTTRRALLASAALAPVLGGMPRGSSPAAAQEATPPVAAPAGAPVSITGQALPGLDGFDPVMTAAMAKWNLPGGQLAIAWGGRLVFNRGYGLADVDRQTPVQPDALFRIASVTKTITTVAILTLVDAGKVALADRAFPLLALEPAANATRDPRLDQITVEE